MRLRKTPLLYALVLTSLFAACKKTEQDVAPTDDNEAITTVVLRLTNKAVASEIVTATIDNLTTTPVTTNATLTLKPNTTYTGVVELTDKSKTPNVDVTKEVAEEKNEHLVVYTPAPATLFGITITDRDTNPAPGPYPVGLAYEIRTNAAGTGTLRVVLRHQPGSKNGTATPGTTDLDVQFPVVVR
jgi:hypothetical protein